MSEFLKNSEYKKKLLKEMIKELHSGKKPEELIEKFRDVLKNVSPLEIPLVEQELVKEGMKPTEIAKLCDLHVLIFRESVKDAIKIDDLEDGHPLKNLVLENEKITKDAEILGLYSATLVRAKDEQTRQDILMNVKSIAEKIKKVYYTHYDREEMVIFPHIERRGLSAVSTVLWRKHDEIRIMIKKLLNLLRRIRADEGYVQKVNALGTQLSQVLVDMVFRENNILYPTLKALLSEGEWLAIKQQEKEFGYYGIEVKDKWRPDVKPIYPYEISEVISEEQLSKIPDYMKKELSKREVKIQPDTYKIYNEKDIALEVGFLNSENLNLIFKYLPIDITYIDENDRVKFYSGGTRLFKRSPSIIGRPVQLCHPPQSVYMVNKILDAFKSGKRDFAEFWIQMGERFVYIKYFALRDEGGNYKGTLEVTQEIRYFKELEGEKRLLDWE